MRSPSILLWAVLLPALAAFLAACGGREISDGVVRNLIVNLPDETLNQDDVSVESVRQNGNNAVVQVSVRTALRLEKVGDEWVIREIRLGDDGWQSLDELLETLKSIKIEKTSQLLGQVVAAIDRYSAKNGGLPPFRDYVSLIDALTPEFLATPIRLDDWRHPFNAERIGADALRLSSAGPDGKFYTSDDLTALSRSTR